MFVSLPLASWWTKSIPDFAVTSSNRSSGPAATGGEAGSARPAAAVPLRDLLPHPGASRASASAGATHRMRLRGPLARLTVSHPKELRSPYLRPIARHRDLGLPAMSAFRGCDRDSNHKSPNLPAGTYTIEPDAATHTVEGGLEAGVSLSSERGAPPPRRRARSARRLLQRLVPALLAVRVEPALEAKGRGDVPHLPVPVVEADIRPERFEDPRVVLPVLLGQLRVGDARVQELDGGVLEELEVALGPLHEDEVLLLVGVAVVGRQDLLELRPLLPEVLGVRRQDVIARHAQDERLLRRAQRAPYLLVDDHVGDEELLVPAREVHVPRPHRSGVSFGETEELGDVVEGGGEFERLKLAVRHGLDQ